MSLSKDAHFEVLGRRGSGWTIVHVAKTREAASEVAEDLWARKQFDGIRVIKESYDPDTQMFNSIDILTRGKIAKPSKHDDAPNLSPCLSPDDLYGIEGRRSIWHLLSNTLSDWALTPSELLHNLEHYYKLYNAGTKLQHAIQRTAVAFENEQESVQERMRKIERLIETCVDQLKAITPKFPTLESGRLKPIVTEIDGRTNRDFLLIGAIAEYIRPAVTISDRFGRVIMMMTRTRPGWVVRVLDQIVAEQLANNRLLARLFQDPEHKFDFISGLMLLSAGRLGGAKPEPLPAQMAETIPEEEAAQEAEAEADTAQDQAGPAGDAPVGNAPSTDEPSSQDARQDAEDAPVETVDLEALGIDMAAAFAEDLMQLNAFVGARMMRESYKAISARLVRELETPGQLVEGSFLDQLQAFDRLRKIADALLADQDLRHNIHAAIDGRAGRLLGPQVIADHMHDIRDPFCKVAFLLDLEKVCHGGEAKREVANLVMPIFKQPHYEASFLGLDGNPVERLRTIVDLQKKILDSGFSEMHRRKMAETLDGFANTILDNSGFLKRLDTLPISPQEKVQKILTMLIDGYFPEGACRRLAEDQARLYMREDRFIDDLLKGAASEKAARERLVDFRNRLKQAGLRREQDSEDAGDLTDLPPPDGETGAAPELNPDRDTNAAPSPAPKKDTEPDAGTR